jgi:uncharacterized repeat protein (TIGR03837 family)
MRCAIFCNIIDNFGDIGVSWRLARQLAHDHQLQVTLFVDDLASFKVLAPSIQPELSSQALDQITIQHWHSALLFKQAFDVIIEGFACRLSDGLIGQMAEQAKHGRPPLWINLEYLSAEGWVMDCHGLKSIHPATGLEQTFWFPSVTESSGGLIREATLIAKRDEFQQDESQQKAFWYDLGLSNTCQYARKISLFSYENKAIADLLQALAQDAIPTLLLVPKSKSIPDIEHWLGQQLEIHDVVQRDALTIAVLPFLSHEQYDRLLWSCDLNFIRGEDSCVRAQWAGKPFIWHIYHQDEDAHLIKLHAWIDRVEQLAVSSTWRVAMQTWNAASPSSSAIWHQLLQSLPEWNMQAEVWSDHLIGQSSLAERLMQWVAKP